MDILGLDLRAVLAGRSPAILATGSCCFGTLLLAIAMGRRRLRRLTIRLHVQTSAHFTCAPGIRVAGTLGCRARRLPLPKLRPGPTTPSSGAQLSLRFPTRRAVVGDAALRRTSPALKARAAERAAEVLPPRVAGIRDEEDPAVPTPSAIPPQLWLLPQDRAQDDVVDRDEPADLVPPMPARAVRLRLRETPLDLYEKNASVSLMMLILFLTVLPSYQPAMTSSRGETGVFLPERTPRPVIVEAGREAPGRERWITGPVRRISS